MQNKAYTRYDIQKMGIKDEHGNDLYKIVKQVLVGEKVIKQGALPDFKRLTERVALDMLYCIERKLPLSKPK